MSNLTIYYGGLTIIMLIGIYLVRNYIQGIYTYTTHVYNTLWDKIGNIAFDTYIVPDNYYRP